VASAAAFAVAAVVAPRGGRRLGWLMQLLAVLVTASLPVLRQRHRHLRLLVNVLLRMQCSQFHEQRHMMMVSTSKTIPNQCELASTEAGSQAHGMIAMALQGSRVDPMLSTGSREAAPCCSA